MTMLVLERMVMDWDPLVQTQVFFTISVARLQCASPPTPSGKPMLHCHIFCYAKFYQQSELYNVCQHKSVPTNFDLHHKYLNIHSHNLTYILLQYFATDLPTSTSILRQGFLLL